MTSALTGVDGSLSELWSAAITNLTVTNTRPARGPDDPDRFIRAGGGYAEPWTRDAAVNAWGAASLLCPEAAADTLRMVCGTTNEGQPIIAQDEQWWDQIVWVVAAREHWLATGDEEFARYAYDVGVRSLAVLDHDRFRPAWGLYAGGAFMQDGISGYPDDLVEPGNDSSFVHDHPLTREIMCLSTNAIYVGALRALADLGTTQGQPRPDLGRRADALVGAIDLRLGDADRVRLVHLLRGAGPAGGRVDDSEEAAGIAFASLFGVLSPERAVGALTGLHREPYGVVNVWPHFDRFSAARPGRHNVMCWPMVMGFVGQAAAAAGAVDVLDATIADLERLFDGSDSALFELYDAVDGSVHGGWQCGRTWPSEPDQTWSATALIKLVLLGVLGLRPEVDGLRFAPAVPARFDGLSVDGVRWRAADLTVAVRGSGHEVVGLSLDGVPVDPTEPLAPSLTGSHRIEVGVA